MRTPFHLRIKEWASSEITIRKALLDGRCVNCIVPPRRFSKQSAIGLRWLLSFISTQTRQLDLSVLSAHEEHFTSFRRPFSNLASAQLNIPTSNTLTKQLANSIKSLEIHMSLRQTGPKERPPGMAHQALIQHLFNTIAFCASLSRDLVSSCASGRFCCAEAHEFHDLTSMFKGYRGNRW